ncbi:hypothetical protein [Ligilactobacillus equi]|uniref:Uncharacterized protein n=1 Tax=Ligilactobacillus equi DSM 15833 = JCM 10991 TaxID=1423740 RepID=A0A0R1TA26_9LACO|nr:hypothetical protein [Ligilactobacillus equi]KRL78223.1 hypothetical protein FC36_GL001109 [Ligilactobacillus equi DSM 15833 = JCM 10991]
MTEKNDILDQKAIEEKVAKKTSNKVFRDGFDDIQKKALKIDKKRKDMLKKRYEFIGKTVAKELGYNTSGINSPNFDILLAAVIMGAEAYKEKYPNNVKEDINKKRREAYLIINDDEK